MNQTKHNVGDIVTSSSLLTMNAFGDLDTDMVVTERVVFKEPHDLFVFTGYVCDPVKDPERKHMVFVRESGGVVDTRLYRLDQAQTVGVIGEHVLVPDGSDFLSEFTTYVEDMEGNQHPVTWMKSVSGTWFGLEAETRAGKGLVTLCSFESDPTQTGFECNLCFVTVFGSLTDPSSVIEIWFGTEASKADIKFARPSKPLI